MTNEQIYYRSQTIVEEIIKDLSDRRGLRQEWNQIDEDIQEEIRETWVGIVQDVLKG
jgi:trans-2-enoyl-CoA reductase